MLQVIDPLRTLTCPADLVHQPGHVRASRQFLVVLPSGSSGAGQLAAHNSASAASGTSEASLVSWCTPPLVEPATRWRRRARLGIFQGVPTAVLAPAAAAGRTGRGRASARRAGRLVRRAGEHHGRHAGHRAVPPRHPAEEGPEPDGAVGHRQRLSSAVRRCTSSSAVQQPNDRLLHGAAVCSNGPAARAAPLCRLAPVRSRVSTPSSSSSAPAAHEQHASPQPSSTRSSAPDEGGVRGAAAGFSGGPTPQRRRRS